MISSFLAEFKINNTWEIGELVDVDILEQKFLIQLGEDESSIIEYKHPILYIRKKQNSNTQKIFKINELIEVLNDKKWATGSVIAQKGNFYLVQINSKEGQTEKFFHADFIRPFTDLKSMITLDLKTCKNISLDRFKCFNQRENYIKRTINKIAKVLNCNPLEENDNIKFVFSNANLQLYIFTNTQIDENLLNDLIDVSFEHFKQIEAKNKELNELFLLKQKEKKPVPPPQVAKNSKNNNNNSQQEWKTAEIVIAKSIYDSEKSKIKGNSVKIEMKKAKNLKDEVSLIIKAKDNKTLNDTLNVLDKVKKYIIAPVPENDEFFNENSPKGLEYYKKMFDIDYVSHIKNDEKSTLIGLTGNKNSVEYLICIINTFFESQEFKNQKNDELNLIKQEILSYTNNQ